MRRQVGIAGLQRSLHEKEKFSNLGAKLATQQLEEWKTQLNTFKTSLEQFAQKYRQEIIKNSAFRLKFQQMCASIGVDPLTRSQGYWGTAFREMNDFYYELVIRIIEVGLALRSEIGPLIPVPNLISHLHAPNVTVYVLAIELLLHDIRQAISLLSPLGEGYSVIDLVMSKDPILVTVPAELNPDISVLANHMVLINQGPFLEEGAVTLGGAGVSVQDIARDLNWLEMRAELCLDLLVTEGLIWIDKDEEKVVYYWVSGMIMIM